MSAVCEAAIVPDGWEAEALIPAYGTGEGGISPRFAHVRFTHALVERLRELDGLVKTHTLDEVSTVGWPEKWELDEAEEQSLMSPQMVVTSAWFYFRDESKHEEAHIETRGIDIETALATLMAAKKGQITLLGCEGNEGVELLEAFNSMQEDLALACA